MAKQSPKQSKIEGVVEYLNLSPKGSYEALLVKTRDGRVQVNFAPELSEQLAQKVKSGDRVAMEVEDYDDDRRGEHPVYSLLSLTGAKGLRIGGAGDSIKGKVERINFAKHGEPNGALLDSGYFVHLKPGGARVVGLKDGQMLEVQGRVKPAAHGAYQVVEAEIVNGIDLAQAKHAAHPPAADRHADDSAKPAVKKTPVKAKKSSAKKR